MSSCSQEALRKISRSALPICPGAEAQAAAEWVGAHPFIEHPPGGYDFEVKERGQNLSAGQAQLVAFARAIAHDAPLLILDEATSNVDPSLEATIQATIERIIQSKTVLIVAHCLSTIESADEILVLGDGEVLERGTHRELTSHGGVYAELLAAGGSMEYAMEMDPAVRIPRIATGPRSRFTRRFSG